jgi:hypothetical protein
MDAGRVKQTLLAHKDLLVVPTTMALYYAQYGTLVGYGMVAERGPLWMELVEAMEVFVVGHEYGHFVLEEGKGSVGEVSDEARPFHEELFADAIGYHLTRAYGNQHENWSAFCGAAPVLFFRSVGLCERVRSMVLSQAAAPSAPSNSHPPLDERIESICRIAAGFTDLDQRQVVADYLAETNLICDAVQEVVQDSVSALQQRKPDELDSHA